MRITGIDVFQVDLPYAGGTYRLSGGREYRSFDATIVRVRTDTGLEGWGESTPFGTTTSPPLRDARPHARRTGAAASARSRQLS
jgi:L-alanine-DL-glutamate epimerase-like enolase superfamily enzyme